MMEYFTIKNWSQFQHYKDRNPPWIKLHYELISSMDWVTLSDASRVLAVACMLIASRFDGKVPDDKEYIKRVAYLNTTPDFAELLSCGFLLGYDGMLADASKLHTNACSEAETEAYSTEEEKDSSCPNSAELVAAEIPEPKVFDPDVMKLGNLLAQRILDNDPKAKIPTTEKQKDGWLDSIEKIHRLDGREWLEIEQVINWCQDDGFWKGNILSAPKLRKQFPQLLVKMKGNGGKKLSGADQIARNKRVLEELNNELEM